MKSVFTIKAIILILILISESNADDFWQKSKGPYGSKISKIAIDSSNGYIYLATKTDGVYRSTNDGQTWNSLNDAVMTLHTIVNSITVGGADTLYAATDTLGIMLKFKNKVWERKTISNKSIYSVCVLNNGSLVAGTSTSNVFISVNKGSTWSSYTGGLTGVTHIYSIVQAKNNTVIAGTDRGIFKSANNGQDWTSADNTTGNVHAFCKSQDGSVLAAGTDKGFYISTNNGDSWTAQNSGLPANTKVISLSHHMNGYFLIGTELSGLFYNTPVTYNWNAYNTGLEALRIRAVATNKQGELFAGTNFAFYKSPDNTSGWTAFNSGLGVRTINRFAPIAEKADILAATDLGIYRTTNSGESWMQLNQGLGDYLDISSIVVARTGDYFAGTKGGGLYYSTNLGDSWSKLAVFSPLDVTTLDTSSTGVLFAGTKSEGVYKSSDLSGKISWSSMNGGYIENKEITCFIGAKNDYLYAGTPADGLYRKVGTGLDWEKVTNLSAGTYVYSLTWRDKGFDGIVYVATNSGIRRTTDNGLSWGSPSGSLPGSALSITACENDWVLVGIKNRTIVYIDSTTKNGDNWVNINSNSGINLFETQTLAVSGRGYIFAGTIGGGCYRSTESTSGRILKVFTDQKDTVKLQQGDTLDINIEVYDGGKNAVSAVALAVNNDMGLTTGNLTTDVSGKSTLRIIIPPNLPDSPPGAPYKITFLGNRLGYLDSEVRTVFLDVQRQKIYLDVVQQDTQYVSWELLYKYTVTATNRLGEIQPNMTISVDDKLLNSQEDLTTDAQGKAEYKKIVPDNHPEQNYEITFIGKDPTNYYFDSDPVKRIVNVKFQDIPIYGPKDVCLGNTYTYWTVYNPDKSFIWKNCIGGQIFTGPSDTLVNIKWDATGTGEFTLEQKIISTSVTTTRVYPVNIYNLPVVTLSDFTNPVCPNVPFDLSTVNATPAGGVFSGPGVNNGIFYGDSAGGAGSYPITYTYTSDIEPYCVDSAKKNITVYALPNVTLNMPKTTVCLSDFPDSLSGGSPTPGTYSGKGVVGSDFDPMVAGTGTHEITYTYNDPTTGCIHFAKQSITVNDAPTTSFIVPNPNICESETAFRLDTFAIEPGTFSGPGVNDALKIFNAKSLGKGKYTIVFETDRVIGTCPGRVAVELEVVGVPGEPTISAGPNAQNPSWIESDDSLLENTWFRTGPSGDTILTVPEGRNNRRITPRRSGTYFALVTGSGCESFPSNQIPFTYIPPRDSFSTEIIGIDENGEIAPRMEIKLKLKIGDVSIIKNNSIDSVSADLVYNASLLYPLDSTKRGTVTNHRRTIPLGFKISKNITNDSDLDTLEFKATVGSEESTELKFENVKAWSASGAEIVSELGIDNIVVKIKVNRNGGETLLFGELPSPLLYSKVKPNPAGETFELDYSISKGSRINIYITNVNGQILKKIFEGEVQADENSHIIDVSDLQTGPYCLILQTDYQKEAKLLKIIK